MGASVLAEVDVTSGYKRNEKLYLPERTADYLDWAAKRFPKVFIPYNVVVKGIEGYQKPPRSNSDEVMRMRRCVSKVRSILLDKYNRSTVSQPGFGIRATIDDEDMLKECVTRSAVRAQSAISGLVRISDKVNIAKVPDCPERTWFKRDLKSVLAGFDDTLRRLALPTR
jgi:hypothetical protein